jgi:hypothetical protein
MLVGQLPFPGGRGHKTALDHVNKQIPLPTLFRTDFPNGFQSVIMRGLAKRREHRYQTIMHFTEDFYKALIDLPQDKRGFYYGVPKT